MYFVWVLGSDWENENEQHNIETKTVAAVAMLLMMMRPMQSTTDKDQPRE